MNNLKTGLMALIIALALGFYGAMGWSIKKVPPPETIAPDDGGISPDDFGPMSTNLRVYRLRDILRSYRWAVREDAVIDRLPAIYSYNALSYGVPVSLLRSEHLPASLPEEGDENAEAAGARRISRSKQRRAASHPRRNPPAAGSAGPGVVAWP